MTTIKSWLRWYFTPVSEGIFALFLAVTGYTLGLLAYNWVPVLWRAAVCATAVCLP